MTVLEKKLGLHAREEASAGIRANTCGLNDLKGYRRPLRLNK